MSIFEHPELFQVGSNFLWHRAPEYGTHGFRRWYAEEWKNLVCVRSISFKLHFADATASLRRPACDAAEPAPKTGLL